MVFYHYYNCILCYYLIKTHKIQITNNYTQLNSFNFDVVYFNHFFFLNNTTV